MKRLFFLVPLCVILGALIACGAADTTATNGGSTPQATKTYQTTHTFTGNGAKKTDTFTVGDSWKIQWSCTGNTQFSIDEPLYITVYQSGNSLPIDSPNTTCKASGTATTGETAEHQGGTFYLDINTATDWTITIQELK